MLRKRLFYISVFLLPLLNCTPLDEDCSAVLCIGPPNIVLEVIANGTNIFENNTYLIEDISLMGTDSDQFSISIGNYQTGDDKITALVLDNPNWKPQDYAITLNFGDEFTTVLGIRIDLSNGNCCSGIPILQSVEIDGIPQQHPFGILKLFLE